MGHVDDPHHAEGDGEADGGEQQNRAERNAEPDILQGPPDGAFLFEPGNGRLYG
ncbi:hypothetical protein D3C72_2574590 [compost metagenome]